MTGWRRWRWPQTRTLVHVGGATAVGFLTGFAIGYAYGSWNGRHILEWGTVPGAVSGLVSAAAFMFAALTFRHELATRRAEDLKRQATLVDAWVDKAAWQPSKYKPGMLDLEVVVGVSNASAQAVRGFLVGVVFKHEPLAHFTFHTVAPTAGATERRVVRLEGWIPEAEQRYPERVIKGSLQIQGSFTDASGNRWHRTPLGELRHLYNLNDKA